MWTFLTQQQQRGAQMHNGGVPKEAVKGRAAQEHDRADLDVSGGQPRQGDYPASELPNRDGDDTPTTPSRYEDWDLVVQPEQEGRRVKSPQDDQPLPEGK